MLAPKAGEVLIRVRAVGVSPVDTYVRAGTYARGPDSYPYTPGNEAAGIVESVGEGVTTVRPGDRVYSLRSSTGAYAEYALAESKLVRRIPDGVSFAAAASVPVPYFTAYRALFQRGKVASGSTVLVHGATGGVGVACLQMARKHGCTVIGTAGSDRGAGLIEGDCDLVVRHGAGAETAANVMRLTKGKGVDTIVEMLANANLQADLTMLARNGTVLIVGSRGNVEINPRDLMSREACAMGVMLWAATDGDFDEAGRYIDAGLADGSLSPIVGEVFRGLESAPQAHEAVIAHSGGSIGKIVISLEGEGEGAAGAGAGAGAGTGKA
jgi:NADPH2:quinone reductase